MINLHDRSGFSLIELLVTISLVGVLSVTALTNYSRFRLMANDVAAQTDVRNAFQAVQSEAIASESSPNFFLINSGPGTLPAPLEHISISSGVTLQTAKWEFSTSLGGTPYNYQYHYAYGYHSQGCYYYYRLHYRYSFGSNENEISYDYKFPYWNRPAECSS